MKPITTREFLAMVDDENIPDAELAKYFVEDEDQREKLSPGLRVNPALVIEETGLESAALLNTANGLARHRRHRAYARKVKATPGAIRIVAEGDSWFQYPFILEDIIDHVAARPDMAVLCYSAGGDVLSNMAVQGEFYAPIEREDARVFLISAGGNDLVDDAAPRQGLLDFLLPYQAGRPAKDYFNDTYQAFMERISVQYDTVFARVLRLATQPTIVCHAYSDAVPLPGKGKWLGKPMWQLGITDGGLQHEIVQIILEHLSQILKSLAVKHCSRVRYVELRGLVPANGWHDEFHPNSFYFGKVAAPIIEEILASVNRAG